MLQIKALYGRLFLRDSNTHHCFLLGAITFDPQNVPQAGQLYGLELHESGLSFKLFREPNNDAAKEMEQLSWADIFRQYFWPVGLPRHLVPVRFVPLLPKTGFFGLVGVADHRSLPGIDDRWFSVSPNHCKTIKSPLVTREEEIYRLAHRPVWPHEGQLYTLGAGGSVFCKNQNTAKLLMIAFQRGELTKRSYLSQLRECQCALTGFNDTDYRKMLVALEEKGITISAGSCSAKDVLLRDNAMNSFLKPSEANFEGILNA